MALTNTVIDNTRTVFGNKRVVVLTTLFDSSYPRGGESLTPGDLGMDSIDMMLISPQDGYSFEYDYDNNLLKAYNLEPDLIVEEVVAINETTDSGTLTQLPLYITSIVVTAGTATGPFNVIPTGETPLTLQCAVTFTSGLLQFVAADDVTSVRVTYIPQKADGPLSVNSLTVDETAIASAATVNLAARAIAVQYVWNDTNGVLCALEPVGEAPSGTNTAVVDITSGSDTAIDTNSTDDGDTLKITYLQYAAFPSECAIEDADITLSGTNPEQYSFSIAGGYNGLVVPGLGTHLVGEATATNVELIWGGPSDTTGAGVPIWNPLQNQVQTEEGTVVTTLAIPWFVLDPHILGDRVSEVPAGRDMSKVATVRVQVWGS
jgi:hypothetical protein